MLLAHMPSALYRLKNGTHSDALRLLSRRPSPNRREGVNAPDTPACATVLTPSVPPPLHLLVVDDHAINRHILEIFLEHMGATWHSVENGAEAVEAVAVQPFDAILMDIRMPIMDGIAATRHIRERERRLRLSTTPIIVISANCQSEDVAASLAAGAQQHLGKPISMSSFYAALATACHAEQRSREPRTIGPDSSVSDGAVSHRPARIQ